MGAFFRLVLALLLLQPVTGFAQADTDPALTLIKKFRIGTSFEPMILRTVSATQTYAMLRKKIAPDELPRWTQDSLAAVVPKYQGKWDRNLADAYAGLLTPAELQSLSVEGPRSPHTAKFMAAREKAGEVMRTTSESLLRDAAQEVLMQLLSRAAGQSDAVEGDQAP